MNQIILSGRLGKDPEIKTLTNGALSTLNLAVTKRVKKGDAWEDETHWFNVKYWKDAKWLSKGDKIIVRGELLNNNYEKKDGSKVYSDEIRALEVELSDKFQSGSLAARSQREVAPAGNDDFDWGEEMPF